VNYTWIPPQLPTTTAAAGRRATSVYMGVDVFGRGSYGGGGFGVGQALSAAREAGLSAALFAPGWVHENLEKTRFHELQDKWWGQVSKHPALKGSLGLWLGQRAGGGSDLWGGKLGRQPPCHHPASFHLHPQPRGRLGSVQGRSTTPPKYSPCRHTHKLSEGALSSSGALLHLCLCDHHVLSCLTPQIAPHPQVQQSWMSATPLSPSFCSVPASTQAKASLDCSPITHSCDHCCFCPPPPHSWDHCFCPPPPPHTHTNTGAAELGRQPPCYYPTSIHHHVQPWSRLGSLQGRSTRHTQHPSSQCSSSCCCYCCHHLGW
jgi:hypothetical protein